MQLIQPNSFFLVASKIIGALLVHNTQNVSANASCLYLCNDIEASQNSSTPSHTKLLAYYLVCAILSLSANTLHVYPNQGTKYILHSFPLQPLKFLAFCFYMIHKVSLRFFARIPCQNAPPYLSPMHIFSKKPMFECISAFKY